MGQVHARARVGRAWGRRALAGVATSAVIAAGLVMTAAPASAAEPTGPAPVEQRNEATVTADPLPTVQIDSGVVWDQVIAGNTVFAGGSFQNARPAGAAPGADLMPRHNILAYDLDTGEATGFAPDINGQVKTLALSPDGATLYVGGSFTQVNGQWRFNLAAFDVATGELSTFKPAIGGSYVNAIAVTEDTVYVGGLIGAAKGVQRKNLAAVSTRGDLLAWAPTADLQVDGMVVPPGADKLIVAGRFTTVNGATQRGLASLDLASGALLPWDAPRRIQNGSSRGSAGIWDVATDGEAVYGTGWTYGSKSDGNLEGAFSVRADTGEVNWVADCHGDHYGVYSDGTNVYTTNHAHDCSTIGGFPDKGVENQRHAVVYTAAAKGTLGTAKKLTRYTNWAGTPAPAFVDWSPKWTTGDATGQGQAGWTVTGDGDYLVVGGEFPFVNGQRSQGIARFARNPAGGAKQGPLVSGDEWTPTAVGEGGGAARVTIPANWDYDDLDLTYRLVDEAGTTLAKTRASVPFWDRSSVTLLGAGLEPGSAHTLRVIAEDQDGNTAESAPVSVTAGRAAVSAYANEVLADGPSLYWRLGESHSAGGADWAGSNDARFFSGAFVSSDSALDEAARGSESFSGTSSGWARTTSAISAPSEFAAEVWFKTTTSDGGMLFGFGDGTWGSSSLADRVAYMTDDGRVVFGVVDGSRRTIRSEVSVNDGQWHHLVAQAGSDGIALFIDGQVAAEDATIASSATSSGYWRIGGDRLRNWPETPSHGYLDGVLDEFAVYSAPLAGARVAAHYAQGSGLASPTARIDLTGQDLDWTLDAAGSTAPDGRSIVSYAWDLGDGTLAEGAQVEHAYADPGAYAVRLTVTDELGLESAETVQVDARAPHTAPVAAIVAQASGRTVAFDAAESSAAGTSDLVDYAWDFGDGTSSSEPAPRHTYAQGGTYEVRLVVTDDRGFSSDPATTSVTVDRVVAADAFERDAVGEWGAADVGGSWSVSDGFSVQDGVGVIDMAPGRTRIATLEAVSAVDVDSRFTLTIPRVANGGGLYADYVVRRTDAGEYRLALKVSSSGAVVMSVRKVVGTTETVLAARMLPDSMVDGSVFQVRVQTLGDEGHTDVAASAWPEGAAEPAEPMLSVTDAEPGLQGPGAVGFRTYLSGSATNGPIRVLVDELSVSDGAEPPAPEAPQAQIATTVDGLTLVADGTGSTVADGRHVTAFEWSFGDGVASDQAQPTHEYAQPGTYEVSLVVVDDEGVRSDAATATVSVAAVPADDAVASDDFSREQSGGWGDAVRGGTWTGEGGFSVVDGAGRIAVAPGQSRATSLPIAVRDAEHAFTVSTSALADGGGLHFSYLIRKTDDGDYRLKIRTASSGTVVLQLIKRVGSAETTLSSRQVPDYTLVPGEPLAVRVQTRTDAGETVLSASAWSAASDEPANWLLAATDAEPALQTDGAIGVQAYLSGSATADLQITMDDLLVR